MKKNLLKNCTAIFTLMLLFLNGVIFAQSAGFNTSFIILNINNNATDKFYDLQAETQNTDFNGANLGSFCQGSSNSLVFKGAEHNVYKCGGCDLSSTRIFYKIYSGAPSGNFVSNNIGFTSGFNNGCGGADQKWSSASYNVNLLAGLNPGTYTFEVYSDATVTCGGTIYAGNNGANFKATFVVNANVTYYADADNDGFGNPAVTQVSCTGAPVGYVSNSTDCNPNNGTVWRTGTFFADADNDGYTTGSGVVLCYGNLTPTGYKVTANGNDCNDANAAVYQNGTLFVDNDNDGFTVGTGVSVCYGATIPAGYKAAANGNDCNDNNGQVYQSASLFVDNDGDGYNNGTQTVCYGATVPAGFSATTSGVDCNDDDATKHATFSFYADTDGDSYGAGNLVSVCAVNAQTPPAGYSLNNTDCNDGSASVYQSAVLFTDADGDGYDNGSGSVCYGATIPTGYSATTSGSDCNDGNASVYRSATLYVDFDNDTFTSGATSVVCYGVAIPSGYVTNLTAIDCNDAVFAINPGRPEVLYNGIDDNCDGNLDEGFQIKTKLLPSSCGTTLASIGSIIEIQTLAPGSAYTGWRIKATNGAQVQIIERNVPNFTMTLFPSYEYATTYTIEIELQRNGVWLGYYGDACLVSTPAVLAQGGATQISPSQCGITLPEINTLISTTSLAGVTGYRFRVSNITDPAGPNAVQIIDRPLQWFSLLMLTRYNYGTQYRIEVAVKTTGAYSGFGSPCTIYSPPAPTLITCGGTIPTKGTLVKTTSLKAVTQYRFQITRVSDNASTTIDRTTNYFTFNMVPGGIFTARSTYAIRVAVRTAESWSPFGDICEINAPGGAATRQIEETPTVVSDEFKATAYPNPFAATFGVDVITSSDKVVQLSVYDMLGKLIETREVQASELNTVKIGDRYSSGVYNVIVTQGETVKTLRVIKR